jgi:hypothetical protein
MCRAKLKKTNIGTFSCKQKCCVNTVKTQSEHKFNFFGFKDDEENKTEEKNIKTL